MVHRKILDIIDVTLRELKNVDKPFGGVRIIAAGDFKQCTPIVRSLRDTG
jgi:hypothetical protein